MNDAEKELLRLTTDLPEWVLRGDPPPWNEDAQKAGCRCYHNLIHETTTLYHDCPLHGDSVNGYLKMAGASVSEMYIRTLSKEEVDRITQFLCAKWGQQPNG